MSQALPVLAVAVLIVAAVSFYFKNNYATAGPAVIIAAFAGAFVAGMGFRPREVVEGMFGYFYPLLGVLCGMLFIRFLYDNGTFDVLFSRVAGMSGASRSIMLLLFIGLPGMITGSAAASLLTTGALAGKRLIRSGMDKTKATVFVAAGSFIGMILPPMNIPAIITTSTSIASGGYFAAYNGFTLPLLLMGLPALIVYGLMAAKDLPGTIKAEPAAGSGSALVPIVVVILLVIAHDFLYSAIPFFLGYPLIFMIGAVLALFLGGGKKLDILGSAVEAMRGIAPSVAVAMAVGSLLEVYMMTGAAGYVGLAQYFTDFRVVGLIFGLVMLALALIFDAPTATVIAVLACFTGSNNDSYTGAAVSTMPLFYAAILAICAVICVRYGFGSRVAAAIGAGETGDKQVVAGTLVPIVLVLAVGLCFAFFGESLVFLRV